MISVREAQLKVLDKIQPMSSEQVSLVDAIGRVLAEDLSARRTQPPMDVSAMDGYAVRAEDVQSAPVSLNVIGAAPAGGAYNADVKAGEAVRIFTGG
ncbi:MAG: molybdopterin molybdenumtransferase MoeA, partial [Alphaproteobacteria bacterium]|nr:molybdopterin molybdenumtransferase MoeA [Alphaproteobacteria bacterium]